MRPQPFAVALLALSLAVPATSEPPGPTTPTPIVPPSTPAADPPFGDFIASSVGAKCQDMIDSCRGIDPKDILNGAMWQPPSHLTGTCYAHDDSGTYPYRYHHYVKQSWRPDAKGYDGGTGAVGYPFSFITFEESERAAGEIIKQLCLEGKCCCPVLPANLDCKDKIPIEAYDPHTGTCCAFPDRCTVPEGWETDPKSHSYYKCH